jgi:hypothetical protein
MSDFVKNLDTPLLQLSPHSMLDLRTMLAGGVHVFGATGGGKSSGTGKTLAAALLRAGFGLLVLCAKPEEVDVWRAYARANGRSRSVILFDERSSFNIIDWLLAKYGIQGLGAVTDCLMRTMEAVDLSVGGLGGASQESFWRDASRQCLAYAIPAIYAAWGRVTIVNVVAFVTTAATEATQYVDAAWAATSYAARTLRKAVDEPAVSIGGQALAAALDYWFKQFTAIPSRTRGNVVISLTTKLDRFVQPGLLRDCFCGDRTDICPEMTFEGAVLIVALPVLTHAEDGIIAQHLIKYAWMRAAESRNALDPVHRERPIALWADEAHHFVSLQDDQFLATCRSARACVVFLSQNLPSYYAKLGENRINTVNGLIGKFNTHVFHLNACTVTNEWASKLIGKGIQRRANASASLGSNRSSGMNDGWGANAGSSQGSGASFGQGGGTNVNSGTSSGSSDNFGTNVERGVNKSRTAGYSETMDFIVEPADFSHGLATGGPANNHRVSSIWFNAGGSFKDGFTPNTLRVTFRQ